jgi:hypothetical protein
MKNKNLQQNLNNLVTPVLPNKTNLINSECLKSLEELGSIYPETTKNSLIRLLRRRATNKGNKLNKRSPQITGHIDPISLGGQNSNYLLASKLNGLRGLIFSNRVNKAQSNLLNDSKYKFMNLKGEEKLANKDEAQIQIWNPSMVLSNLNTYILRNKLKRNLKFRLGKKLIKDLSLIKDLGAEITPKSKSNFLNPSLNNNTIINSSFKTLSHYNPEIKISKSKTSLINKTQLLPYLIDGDLLNKGENQNSSNSNINSLTLFNKSSRRKLKLFKRDGKFWHSDWKKKIKIGIIRENYRMKDSDKLLLSIIKERRFNLRKKFSGIVEPSKIRRGPGFSFIKDNLLKNQFIKYKFQNSSSPYGTTGELASNSLRSISLRNLKNMGQNSEVNIINYFKSYNLGTQSNQILKPLEPRVYKGLGLGPVSASHIDFESFHKLLKSFFNTLSSLISLPVIESLPDKLNIRLFYYLKGNKHENRKLRRYKSYVKNSGKLFKEIMLRALISSKVGKESLALFLSNWKLLNNERIISRPEAPKAVSLINLNSNNSNTQAHTNENLNISSKLDLSNHSAALIAEEPELISNAIYPSQPRPGSREPALIAMERFIENLNSDSELINLSQRTSNYNNETELVQDSSRSNIKSDNLKIEKNSSENIDFNKSNLKVKKNTNLFSENLDLVRDLSTIRHPALELLEGLSKEFLKIKIANPLSSAVRKQFKEGPVSDSLKEEEKLLSTIKNNINKNASKPNTDEFNLDLLMKTNSDITSLLVNLRNLNKSPLNISNSKAGLEDKLTSDGELGKIRIRVIKGFENIKFKKLSEFILENYKVLYLYPLLIKLNIDKYNKPKAHTQLDNFKDKGSKIDNILSSTLTKGSGSIATQKSLVPGVNFYHQFKWNNFNKDFKLLEGNISSLITEKKKEFLSSPIIKSNSSEIRPIYKKYLSYLIYSIYALYRSYLKTKIIRGYLSKVLKNYNKVVLELEEGLNNKNSIAKLSKNKVRIVSHNLMDVISLDKILNGKLIERELKDNKIISKEEEKYLNTFDIISLNPNFSNALNFLKDTPYAPYAQEAINTISLIFDSKIIKDITNTNNNSLRKNKAYKEDLNIETLNQNILKYYCQGQDLLNMASINNNGNIFKYGLEGTNGKDISNWSMAQIIRRRPSLQIVQWEDTIVRLNFEKIKIFIKYLEKLFNKSIQLDLTRLHYPYHESNILSQVLGKSSKSRFSKFYRMMKTLEFTASVTQPGVKLYSNNSKIKTLPSLLSGFKVKLAGRLLGEGMRPRFSVRQYQVGTLSKAKIGYKNTSRFTFKNKRGAYSLTVTMSHIFENINPNT